MLEAARRRRVTGELELRRLDFLEKELSIIVAGLTALGPHVDEDMMGRLEDLTLLRRTARCIHRRHRPWWLMDTTTGRPVMFSDESVVLAVELVLLLVLSCY